MGIGNKGGGGSGGKDVRAGGAYFEIWGKDALTGVLEGLKLKAAAFSKFMTGVGKAAGVAGAAIAAPLAVLFRGGANRAADIARMADEFGVPIELMARIKHAADDAGASVQDVMSDETGRFDKLLARPSGVDPKQARQAAEAQREFAEATRALEYALLPLLDVITPVVAQVAGFAKENAALVRVAAAAAAGLLAISAAAVAVGPALSLLAGGGGLVLRLAASLFALVRVLAAVRLAMALTAVKTAALVAVKTVWFAVTTLLSGGLALLSTAVAFLLSPIGLVTVAAVALAYVFRAELMAAGSEAGQVLGDAFRSLAEIFGQTWKGITDAVKAGDLELAFRIVAQGVRTLWAQLLVSLANGWNNFVQRVADTVKRNRWLTAAVGAAGGGAAGFAIGGPLGGLIGFAGGGLGGALAGEYADDLADLAKVGTDGLAAGLAGAKAGLTRLTDEAAAAAKDADKYKGYKSVSAAIDSVKGNFQTFGTARQQFGYGNETTKQTALQLRIANGVEAQAGKLGDLAEALKAK